MKRFIVSRQSIFTSQKYYIQCMLPPLFMNNEQTREIILGRYPMVFPSFLTATAYPSCSYVSWLPFECIIFYNSPQDCLVNVVVTNAQISAPEGRVQPEAWGEGNGLCHCDTKDAEATQQQRPDDLAAGK